MAATLATTIGSLYVGIIFSAMFGGITIVQSYNYYIRYPHDWMLHKVSVGILWLLDMVHLGLSIHLGYFYLIDSFGNLPALNMVVWSLKAQITINVVIILMVQSLYTVRIWKLGKGQNHNIIPGIVTAIVVGDYAIGIILAVLSFRQDSFSTLGQMGWAIDASLAAATCNDFVIAVAMIFYLQKSKSGFASTNLKVSSLIQYTLGSGIVTSACSLSALIAYVVMPDNLIFMAIEYSLTKLYINSFLAMLNARKSIRGKTEDGVSISLSELRSGSGGYPSPGGVSQLSAKRHPGAPDGHQDEFGSREAKSAFVWPEPKEV